MSFSFPVGERAVLQFIVLLVVKFAPSCIQMVGKSVHERF